MLAVRCGIRQALQSDSGASLPSVWQRGSAKEHVVRPLLAAFNGALL